jgi:hypothetical protein
MMKYLNISELRRTVYEKERARINVYDVILEKCHNKITISAERELYECEYNVPNYVVGLPLFDVSKCIDYMQEQLRANGFTVRYVFPKKLVIGWHPTKTNEEETVPTLGFLNDKGKFVLNVD